MKRVFLILPFLAISLLSWSQNEKYANISKYSDIYHSVLRELDLNYVDSIKQDQLTEAAIARMLYSLDPYTTYYPESKEEDVRRLRSGEYGGIGAIVMQRKDGVYIGEPFEGMPAQKHGLVSGDKFVEIDGKKADKLNMAQVSDLLRGTPGTTIEIKIKRDGVKAIQVFKFPREVIQTPTISYYSLISDSIGYIVIDDFIERTTTDFKYALDELKKNYNITSLIIDLRDNGGGLVDQAVNIAGLFLPRNSAVVSMKGRTLPEERVYKTTSEPLYPNMPLVVMINSNTASASEILAGALQDYDRAVILGERSFGKGLVQNIRRMPYNGYLKVTTARYYTPSGRCVQAIDYALRQNNERERIIPDSLTSVFKTAKGRSVRDGGGITPDVKMKGNDEVNIAYYLYNQNIFFDYATQFKKQNPTIADMKDFVLTDAQYQDFVNYVLAQNFTYQLESDKYVQELKDIVKIEGYSEQTDSIFKELSKALQPNVSNDLYRFRPEVQHWVEQEIIKRYYYQKGAHANSLHYDNWYDEAISILQNPKEYHQLLEVEDISKK